MTTPLYKTVGTTLSSLKYVILPPLVLAADFTAVLAVSMIVLWLIVVMPITALAQEMPSGASTSAPQIIHASIIDIDRDGTLDRAVLARNPKTQDADLYIYLKADDLTPTPVRPDIVKAGIAEGRVLDFKKHDTSLEIMTGCGGCSNDTATRITIVHRGGQFLIGGYAFTWDTRAGRGHCEINFLTGRGTLSVNGRKAKPLAGRFKPVRLADWRKDAPPKACAG